MNGNINLPKAAEAKPQEDAGPKKSFAVIVSLRVVFTFIKFYCVLSLK